MTATLDDRIGLGTGVYSVPRARQLLGRDDPDLTLARLRGWIRHGLIGEEISETLTFVDLVSLEVVRRMIRAGVSAQAVRKTGVRLREDYDLARPFACDIFYVHRDDAAASSVWAKHDEVIFEIVGSHPDQAVLEDALRTFAKGIVYDEHRQAKRWDVTEWIVIDPAIQFGEPTIKGTRVSVQTVESNLAEGTPEEVADWYLLTVEQVLGVRDYVAASP